MSVRSNFECPICIKWMGGEIIQCVNGHIVCRTCYSQLRSKVCPSCRISCTRPIRNRAMEEFRDKFEPCKHLGCSEFVLKTDTQHATQCAHQPPTPPTWNGHPYAGEWLHGRPHGEGTGFHIQTTNICDHFKVVMGHWKHHPKNSILWKYTGNWIDGIPQGFGEAESGEPYLRISYEGDWKNGFAHGDGISRRGGSRNTVTVYNGGWRNGLFHGKGTVEADGADALGYPNFEGVFENDTLVSGEMTIGFSDDMKSYDGEFTNAASPYPPADIYICSWLPHGTGTMTFANGDTYEGHFENGQPVNVPPDVRQQLYDEQQKVKELQAQLQKLCAGQKRKRTKVAF